MHSRSTTLKEIARVAPGHPIRGAVESVPGGDVAVVQIKNMSADKGVDWAGTNRTTLTNRRNPDWLKSGDIIFSARGQRNVAVCLDQPPSKAVCSPHLFLIRVEDERTVLPEFLAWQLNVQQVQRYFAMSATGSFITSIRRQVLEETRLVIPSLEKQRLLVNLSQAALREKELLEQLIQNRQQGMDLVAGQLLA